MYDLKDDLKYQSDAMEMLKRMVLSQMEEEPDLWASLSNTTALIMFFMEDLNWAGFYRMVEGDLVLGPFQGKPACNRIEVGSGVCGTAVAERKTQRVPDVHAFPGHIACDSASKAELVVPIMGKNGQVWGVLDLDSPKEDRFSESDQKYMEELVKILETRLLT